MPHCFMLQAGPALGFDPFIVRGSCKRKQVVKPLLRACPDIQIAYPLLSDPEKLFTEQLSAAFENLRRQPQGLLEAIVPLEQVPL